MPWNNDYWHALFEGVDNNEYPWKGFWPNNQNDIPEPLTPTICMAIKSFAQHINELDTQGKEFQKFIRKNHSDAWNTGRKEYYRAFDRLVIRAKLMQKLEQILVDAELHPISLLRDQKVGFILDVTVAF